MHTVKASDLKTVRFRDKGTPADNLSNYDSSKEQIIYVAPMSLIEKSRLVFVTAEGLVKLTEGQELVSTKRTVASTKLGDNDRLILVSLEGGMEQIVLQTSGGAFLRFPLPEISLMKKNAAGTKGIRMKDGESVEHAYLLESRTECMIEHRGKPFSLSKVKLGKRGGVGVRPRG